MELEPASVEDLGGRIAREEPVNPGGAEIGGIVVLEFCEGRRHAVEPLCAPLMCGVLVDELRPGAARSDSCPEFLRQSVRCVGDDAVADLNW
eukprot:347547-Heterocapsa_arctica.AAC.1